MLITYLGNNGLDHNQVDINGMRYSFKLSMKKGCVIATSFRDMDGTTKGKIVARTYKAFKRYLNIESSILANRLICNTTHAYLYYPECFKNTELTR